MSVQNKEVEKRIKEMLGISLASVIMSTIVVISFLVALGDKIFKGGDISQTFLNGFIPLVVSAVFWRRHWILQSLYKVKQRKNFIENHTDYVLSDGFDKVYVPQRVYVFAWLVACALGVLGLFMGGLNFDDDSLTGVRWIQTMVSVIPLYLIWIDSWKAFKDIQFLLK
ncbi:hypothetical protein [Rothia nasimurium]|uniref:hypothetical protein n=1 Tax=Rothia nasimurium TaxID=85336 RepID=UPI001F1BF8D3|nr:hypothetical protein [Rothia nasimurium]